MINKEDLLKVIKVQLKHSDDKEITYLVKMAKNVSNRIDEVFFTNNNNRLKTEKLINVLNQDDVTLIEGINKTKIEGTLERSIPFNFPSYSAILFTMKVAS